MTIYISGPMTGIHQFNYPAFESAAVALRAAGYIVVSPHEVNPDTDKAWAWYLQRDIKALMDCDAIALLPGYRNSRGATLELHIAEALRYDVFDVVDGKLVPRDGSER